MIAQLLAVDSNPFTKEALIDKGKKQGVFVGQPVLDAYGIYGQIIEVNEQQSRILLIPIVAVPFRDKNSRNGGQAIARWHRQCKYLDLTNVPETEDIKPGDIMLSSGLGGGFAFGYPLGIVTSVSPDASQLFLTIALKPYAHLNRGRNVILVWPPHTSPNTSEGNPHGS